MVMKIGSLLLVIIAPAIVAIVDKQTIAVVDEQTIIVMDNQTIIAYRSLRSRAKLPQWSSQPKLWRDHCLIDAFVPFSR